MNRSIRLGSWTCVAIGMVMLAAPQRLQSCTIFAATRGSDVLVGNNEDGTPGAPAYLWFVPATKDSLGYVLWGAERAFPEGGLNERGLFFDAASLPERIPIERDSSKPDFTGYLVEPVLARFGSVEDAVADIARFNLVEQERAQIFLADERGDVAIVHANYVLRESGGGPYLLTNHAVVGEGARAACWRRGTARSMLASRPVSLETVAQTLAATAQRDPSNSTNYSQAVDLGRRRFALYWARDFAHPVRIDLAAELARGPRTVPMETLFPRSLVERIAQESYAGAIAKIDRAAITRAQWEEAGAALLRQSRLGEAIALYDDAIRASPRSAALRSARGVAALMSGRDRDARTYFDAAAALDPDDHAAGVFSATNVRFVLDRYRFAERVEVVGDFSGTSDEVVPLRKSNGRWIGEIPASTGKHYYALHVDDTWVIDVDNPWMEKRGEYFKSVLVKPGALVPQGKTPANGRRP